MKILGIIPARKGSKGILNKNIKILGSDPLISYTIKSCKKAKLLENFIVSTDSNEIAKISKKYGASVPFLRPSKLATDKSKSIDLVIHAINFFEKKNTYYDAICLLQATCPFRDKNLIDDAIRKFKKNNFQSLISVLPIPHQYNPYWAFKKENDFLRSVIDIGEIISRRQDLPQTFYRDGSIYITRVETIKTGTFYGETIGYIENSSDFHVNIDTETDWINAELIAKELKK
tara:strand:- start:29 stop:721 length:693 start_codon:yes stop_codon:yes gene_type:complete